MEMPQKIRILQRLPALGMALLVLGLAGCGEKIDPTPGTGPADGLPAVAEPLMKRDLEEIRRTGILRVITYYSPRTYFIHKGGQAGFEFELVSRFADKENLTLEIVIAEPGDDLVSLLNEGRGDLACVGQPLPPGFEKFVSWTRPTNFTRKVVVLPEDSTRPDNIQGLAGMTVTLPHGCPFLPALRDLRRAGSVAFRISNGPPLAEPEELMAQVARHQREAVVVDDIAARAGMAWIPGLRLGPALGERRPTTWLLRKNSPDLKAALDDFLKGHLKVSATGRVRRSQTYGIIYDRYFENERTIRGFRDAASRPDKSGRISRFDDEIRRQAEAAGLDWRLVAALIYQESRFYPNALSKADARGLMQVIPSTGRYIARKRGIKKKYNLFDTETSVDFGTWYFARAFHGTAGDVPRSLAGYNAGPGRATKWWAANVGRTYDEVIERIPFDETRYYVKIILRNWEMYQRLYADREIPPGRENVFALLPRTVEQEPEYRDD